MSSKRRLRRKQCLHKNRHKCARDAGREIIAMRRRYGHQGQLSVYRCPFCSMYHVGHTPGMNGIGTGYR